MANDKPKRNIFSEICIVILGTALVILSLIGSQYEAISEEDNENLNNACKLIDDYGNYEKDDIKCINGFCYLSKTLEVAKKKCSDDTNETIDFIKYDEINNKYNETLALCDKCNEDGLYIDKDGSYCKDEMCSSGSEEVYQVKCSKKEVEEPNIPDEMKAALYNTCTQYQVSEENNLEDCSYGICHLYDETNELDYRLDCDLKKFSIVKKDDMEAKDIIQKNLYQACQNEEVDSEYQENIYCSQDICSFKYQDVTYYRNCIKKS